MAKLGLMRWGAEGGRCATLRYRNIERQQRSRTKIRFGSGKNSKRTLPSCSMSQESTPRDVNRMLCRANASTDNPKPAGMKPTFRESNAQAGQATAGCSYCERRFRNGRNLRYVRVPGRRRGHLFYAGKRHWVRVSMGAGRLPEGCRASGRPRQTW